MVDYKKLWIMLIDKGMSKQELAKEANFSLSTLTKLNKNELVALSVLVHICETLSCDIGDIMEVTK